MYGRDKTDKKSLSHDQRIYPRIVSFISDYSLSRMIRQISKRESVIIARAFPRGGEIPDIDSISFAVNEIRVRF